MDIISKKKELVSNMLKESVAEIVLELIDEGKNITMDEVAAKAGVSKGTLYNYFSDRKSLLEHVHFEITKIYRGDSNPVFISDKPPYEQVCDFIHEVMHIPESLSKYFHFSQTERTIAQEAVDKYEMVIKPLAVVCEKGIKEGTFIDINPFIMAEMIYGTVIGTLTLSFIDEIDMPDKDTLEKEFMKLIDNMIIKERSNI